jgi:hypothetical protein
MLMKGYNYALVTSAESPSLDCTGPSGPKRLTATSTSNNQLLGKQTTCKNYAVSGVSVNGVAVAGPYPVQSSGSPAAANGSLTEYTSISLPAINANDVVNITTSSEADYLPLATCSYVAADLNGSGIWKNNASPTVTAGSCRP